jgi:hypothetical protein
MAEPASGITFFFSVLYGENNNTPGVITINSSSDNRLQATIPVFPAASQFITKVIEPGVCAFLSLQNNHYLRPSTSNSQIEAIASSFDHTCIFRLRLTNQQNLPNQFEVQTFEGTPLRVTLYNGHAIVVADNRGISPFYVVPVFDGRP